MSGSNNSQHGGEHYQSPHPENQVLPAIRACAQRHGFEHCGVAGVDLSTVEPKLQAWLEAGYQGDMHYMAAHGCKRTRPAELVPGTLSVISVTLPYWPSARSALATLQQADQAYISRYALGRDYHKVVRQRLQHLAEALQQVLGSFGYRVFTDSAPVMEVALAEQAGLGWRGKNTLLLNRQGSLHFLGEIYTDLPLPPAAAVQEEHCGGCTQCLQACPTQAFVAPYVLDARRCISYLTIEYAGVIPEPLRPLLGNRIYGCDDCQLVCPWNRFAQRPVLPDFAPRHGLDALGLLEALAWDEATFLQRMEGSPIRRIGHSQWLRNVTVAVGNHAAADAAWRALAMPALARWQVHPSEVVQEHVRWAMQRLEHAPTVAPESPACLLGRASFEQRW